MKGNLALRIGILGMLFLPLLFVTCQKDNPLPLDEEITLLDDQQIEERNKCTKTQTGNTFDAPVTSNPTPQQVDDALRPKLTKAADAEKDPVVKAVLNSIIATLAGDAVIMSNFLNQPDVAGLTRSYFKYSYYKGKLVIVVVNIVLLEDSKFKAHEDGHAYIADEVAKKCAEKAAKDSGKDCKDAGEDAVTKLRDTLNKDASDLYDKNTNSGQKGDQAKEAKKAAKVVIDKYLKK